MSATILERVPRGKDLTRAVADAEDRAHASMAKAQISRGLAASADPTARRTPHAEFMAELKAKIMDRINAG